MLGIPTSKLINLIVVFFIKKNYFSIKNHILFFLQIRFFHKMASRLAPVTGGEKLIFGVFEAERPTIRLLNGFFNYLLER